MKTWFCIGLALALIQMAPEASCGSVHVKGYFKKDGTYVAPHYRSSPNSSTYDNYSTQGNYNPYTGQVGRVDPYKATGAASGTSTASSIPSYSLPSYRPPTYAPANYVGPKASIPSVAGTAATNGPNLLPGYDAALRRAAYREPTAVGTEAPNPAEERATAEVAALAARYRATDGMFEAKLTALQPQIRQIQSTLPPEQWAPAIQAAWANLSSQLAAQAVRSPVVLYLNVECQEAASKAEELAYAARNLEGCASRGDLSDDCHREARDARSAADDYESALDGLTIGCS